MSYIKEFEAELAKKLQSTEPPAAIAKWLSEKVLESYKNGLAAGRKRSRGENASPKAE